MTDSKSVSDPIAPQARVRIAGLTAALAAALLLVAIGGERASQPLFDLYQRTAPRDLSGSPVHVVLIDPDSVARYGPWPWPRYHLARLTEKIAAEGAAAIGFDVIFPERDRISPDIFAGLYPELSQSAAAEVKALPPMDEVFGNVIGAHPVVLGRAGVPDAPQDSGAPGEMLVEAGFTRALTDAVLSFPHAIINIPELEEVAAGHGLLNAPTDPDGAIRKIPLVARAGGQDMPTLSLEVARVGLGLDEVEPVIGGGGLRGLRLGDRMVRTDPEGRIRLRFGELPAADRSLALEWLDGSPPTNALAGKFVLIGPSADGTSDVVPTPIGSTFGVLVQAQATDAVLRGGWLDRPAWALAIEWGLALLVVALIVWLAPARRTAAISFGLIVLILAIAGSWTAFAAANLLLSPLPPLVLGGAASAGVLGAAFVNARRERERLRGALLREQLKAAEAAGELQAARGIQMGMLPPPELLANLDPRLEVDALLEPARSVGGDFYDAVTLSRDCVGFVIGDVTGKGVPASLFMALSKALTKSVMLREGGDLTAAATILDEELSRDNVAEMSVTMLIGLINLSSGAVIMCSAGHEHPLLIQRDGAARAIQLEGGPPFCVAPGFSYPSEHVALEAGDTLVLVTDGVTEGQNRAGELFGQEPLVQALRGARSAGEATRSVLQAVRRFEGDADPADDLTVLALRWRGHAA